MFELHEIAPMIAGHTPTKQDLKDYALIEERLLQDEAKWQKSAIDATTGWSRQHLLGRRIEQAIWWGVVSMGLYEKEVNAIDYKGDTVAYVTNSSMGLTRWRVVLSEREP